jgi:hypothetical protein
MSAVVKDVREWYLPEELAGLPGMPETVRVVNLYGARGCYERRHRERGKGWTYAYRSLPLETQAALTPSIETASAALLARPDATTPAGRSFACDRERLWRRHALASDRQREAAAAKVRLLDQVIALTEAGMPQRHAFECVGRTSGVPWRTIENWYQGNARRPGARHYDRRDWPAALIAGHVGRTVIVQCSDDAWECFKADYLRLEKPAASACYGRLLRSAGAHGWQVPSLYTLKRRIVRDIPQSVRCLRREGEQALMRLYPPQRRSVRDLHALEWLNGDGYQHNVFVRWPDGTIARPKTWLWQDVFSRKHLAWRVDQTEHTDVIRLAFGDVVERYGIPDHVTIDNTRAAANKWMTGGVPNRYRFKVRSDDPLGLLTVLGVRVHWTSVHRGRGHGQAKPIERSFGVGGLGEVVDRHPALAGAYTGHSTVAKPENYRSRAVPLEQFLAVLEQELTAWNAQPKRRTEAAAGLRSFDEVFEASYARSAIRKATAEQRAQWLLAAEAITVHRDGTVTLDAGKAVGIGRNRYRSNLLHELAGERVVVRFDPDRLHEDVHVYTLDGRYIDRAICIDDVGFGDTQAAREHQRAREAFLRATRAAAAAQTRMSTIEVAGHLPAAAPPAPPTSTVTRTFQPVASRPRLEPRALTPREQQLKEEMLRASDGDNVFTIPHTDPEQDRLWKSLDERVRSGEALSADEARFHGAWQHSRYFQAARAAEAEFEARLSERAG